MKKVLFIIFTAVIMLSVAACGTTANAPQITTENTSADTTETENTGVPANETETAPAPESALGTPDESVSEITTSAGNNVLVVYFSWSGNLDKMSHWVSDETGGDLIRVTAKEAYPENYNDTADRAKNEVDNGIRPGINVDLTPEQLAQYDTIFFGFPVWWYDLPMAMWTFLESYDWEGKTMIPFFSHEGSSNGAGALPRVTELAQGANVRTGDALSIRGGKVASSENEVRDWVKGLGYSG